MIFDERLDRALWLLLVSNEDTRGKVSKLISFLPEEIYIQIQASIINYYMNGKTVNKDGLIFDTTYNGMDNYHYYVNVKMFGDELVFRVSRWIEDTKRVEEVYELNLVPILLNNIEDMLMLDVDYVGSYLHEINNISFVGNLTEVSTENFDREYMMVKVPFGHILSTSKGYRVFNLKGVNIIKKMPSNILLEDFKSERRLNRLVRKRNRK